MGRDMYWLQQKNDFFQMDSKELYILNPTITRVLFRWHDFSSQLALTNSCSTMTPCVLSQTHSVIRWCPCPWLWAKHSNLIVAKSPSIGGCQVSTKSSQKPSQKDLRSGKNCSWVFFDLGPCSFPGPPLTTRFLPTTWPSTALSAWLTGVGVCSCFAKCRSRKWGTLGSDDRSGMAIRRLTKAMGSQLELLVCELPNHVIVYDTVDGRNPDKSCTTLDGWNPICNGINHLSTGAGFPPSSRYMSLVETWETSLFPFLRSRWRHLGWTPRGTGH